MILNSRHLGSENLKSKFGKRNWLEVVKTIKVSAKRIHFFYKTREIQIWENMPVSTEIKKKKVGKVAHEPGHKKAHTAGA